MPAHALEDAVRAGLQRRVQVGGKMTGSLDEQAGERIVDDDRAICDYMQTLLEGCQPGVNTPWLASCPYVPMCTPVSTISA